MAEAWYVTIDGERQGPLSAGQLKQMAANGTLGPDDLLWKEGMRQWVRCDSVRGLFPPAPMAGGVRPPTPPRVGGPGVRGASPPPRRTAAPISPAVPPATPGADPFAAGYAGFTDVAAGQVPGVVPATETAAGSPGSAGLQFAEFMPRVGAAVLDALFLGLLGCIPVGLVFGLFGAAAAGAESEGLVVLGQVAANILGLFIAAGYFILLECSEKQGTWGKQIVGIKVTDLEGQKITYGRAAARFFSKYFLSNCTCGIGYLMPLFTAKKQTLRDIISGCLAIKK
jgi:uncharacterized RDD family membrane protein YckC